MVRHQPLADDRDQRSFVKIWNVVVSFEVEADDEDEALREANRQVHDGIVESITLEGNNEDEHP